MINQDVIDLYDRTAAGAKVVVLSAGPARSADRLAIPAAKVHLLEG
jgi:hypothetical protein